MRRKFIVAPLALAATLALAGTPVSADDHEDVATDAGGEVVDATEVDAADPKPWCKDVPPPTGEEVTEEEPAEEVVSGEEPAEEVVPGEEPAEDSTDDAASEDSADDAASTEEEPTVEMQEMEAAAEIGAEAANELGEEGAATTEEETTEEELIEEEAEAGDETDAEEEISAEENDAEEEIETDEEVEDSAPELGRARDSLRAALARLCQPGVGGNGVAAQVLRALIDGVSPGDITKVHVKDVASAAAERRSERKNPGRGRPDHAGPRIDTAPEVEEEVEPVEDGELGDVEQSEEAAAETEVVVQAEDAGRPDHAGGPKSDGKVAGTSDNSAGKSGGRPADAGNGGKGGGKGRP